MLPSSLGDHLISWAAREFLRDVLFDEYTKISIKVSNNYSLANKLFMSEDIYLDIAVCLTRLTAPCRSIPFSYSCLPGEALSLFELKLPD